MEIQSSPNIIILIQQVLPPFSRFIGLTYPSLVAANNIFEIAFYLSAQFYFDG
jgi:hypothetical protein